MFSPQKYVHLQNPDWVENATLYELNIRQFSEEGTFKAVENQLPRLKKMGINIIWLMPVHPIGIANRKGSLGSYYSVKDFLGINPEFGNEDDFRHLVRAIHTQGMYVILDWVANHSSCDNHLVTDHPDWYLKSPSGNFVSTPWRDYDDILNFNYKNAELREYMINAMKFWVKEYDIDGYRCDLAAFVPIDFWENVRQELEKIKPIFMVAEAEDRDLHRKAFDATYNWRLWRILHEIAILGKSVKTLTEGYLAEHVATFPKAGIRVNFIDNHDINSWEGDMYSNFGEALRTMIVFTVLMDGMPLIYNGQEAGLDRSLQFFDKDPITWKIHENANLYTTLFHLKHKNQALWNGRFGGEMLRIENDCPDQVLSFSREKNGSKVLAIFNLSKQTATVSFDTSADIGIYLNIFSQEIRHISEQMALVMEPWDFSIWHTAQ